MEIEQEDNAVKLSKELHKNASVWFYTISIIIQPDHYQKKLKNYWSKEI